MKYLGSKKHVENIRKAQKNALVKIKYLTNKRIENYYLAPNKCNECNNVIFYNKKNNKFCSSSCAAKFNNKKRGKRDKKTKKKISKSLKLIYGSNIDKKSICKNCGKLFKLKNNSKSIYCSNSCMKNYNGFKDYNNHYRFCENCDNEFKVHKLSNGRLSKVKYCSKKCKQLSKKCNEIKYNVCLICDNGFELKKIKNGKISKAKYCSNKRKSKALSISVKKRIKTGEHKGWKNRSIVSYPEKFFIKVLKNNNINFEHNYPIKQSCLGIENQHNYFLDFFIPEKNIDLEIDGSQHKYRKEHDKLRDELLTKNGYNVYRIKWKNINTSNGKKYIKEEINKFLDYYNNIE